MNGIPKLTKKQKKSLAFRERKKSKPSSSGLRHGLEMEDIGLPAMEIQDLSDSPSSDVEARSLEGKAVRPGKQPRDTQERDDGRKDDHNSHRQLAAERLDMVAHNEKKRKREGEQESSVKSQMSKRKKTEGVPGVNGGEAESKAATVTAKTKQRFILFLGNLKYTTSRESILEHFSACDPPPTIRLLSPKSQKSVNKSKGCAFLEFTHRNALQQALKLHHSELEGRKINVELTAGGGGKSTVRLDKVQRRNRELHDQRKKRQQKAKLSDPPDHAQAEAETHQQRYSSTAGIEQPSRQKRTWTVEDAEDGLVHRGGQKHAKNRSRSSKTPRDWRTGVNTIPLG